MENLEGQTFAGYEILSKLGQGGMGAVYKARQPMLNRLVALKMMAPNLSGDPAFVARFIREASAAANLNHPNMVQVYTAGENDKIYYIVMEFVEGESLRVRLDRMERIPPQEAVAVTVYIAQALQYAWNKAHLIHRDIKPDNVFLSNSGEVKVGDLGLAKSVGGGETTDMTQTGMVMGSPHYISPEQAQGLKDIDFRTDIYSLGCTLYHMLTGKTPYEGDSSMVIMMKHINDPPPAIFRTWPACPMPLGMLVGKMLAKDRNARPQSYEDLVADLMQVHEKLRQTESVAPVATTPAPTGGAAAVSDTVPKAKQTGTAVTTQAKTGNQKLVYAAAGACALVALAGVLWWAPWKTAQRESVTVISQGQPSQPAELPRQEVTASVTPPAPVAPPAQLAPATPSAPVADSAPSAPQPAIPTAAAPFDAAQARQHQEAWAKHLQVPVEMTNSIGMKFVLIPPGEFDMGTAAAQVERELEEGRQPQFRVEQFYIERVSAEAPQHRVKITRPFYLAVCEVTQGEYEQIISANPSAFCATGTASKKVAGKDTRRHPVEVVSWPEAGTFAQRLSALPAETSAQRGYRLPTEAEWECACRAGTTTRWSCGDDEATLLDYAWFKENSDGVSHPVGEKKPNPWGLFDMHGNVWEWCSDRYTTNYYSQATLTDPQGPPLEDAYRVVRGAGWDRHALGCRSAYRGIGGAKPWPIRNNFIGFRLACEVAARSRITSTAPDAQPSASAAPTPAAPASATAAAALASDGFLPLFNGRDLTGWEGRPEFWSVQDGAICGRTTAETPAKQNTFLVCKAGEFDDFELRAQFKFAPGSEGNRANSGIQYRSKVLDADYFVVGGYQADMGRLAGKNLDGSLYEERGRGVLIECGQKAVIREGDSPRKTQVQITGSTASAADIAAASRRDDWNDIVIIARGNRLQHFLNGTPMLDVTDETAAAARTGIIALQIKSGPPMQIWFRNPRIKKLTPEGQTNATTADGFVKEVTGLTPDQQVARVVAKLKELNPNFDGKETHKVEGGAVTELAVSTTGVTDITPVKALKQLRKLTVAPWAMNQKGSLSNLSPLKELPLAWLYCQNNPVSDLSPLRGLPLTVLGCGGTQVSDLSPLAGMKLTVLSINDTAVSDLAPLNGMPLTVLWCNNTKVTDFTPLRSSPLQELRCDFQPQRDAEALRGIPTLRKINDQTAAVLLRQFAASAQAPRTPAPSGDIRVLIVTGVDLPSHDWRSTGPAIREEMQKDSRMKVEILNDIYRLDSMDLTKFQVVLLNFYTRGKPDPNEQARDNLKNFVNRGGGLIVFHSTCGSFRDWPEFRDLAGKIMSHEKPAYDKVGPMRVKIINANHPITRGMQSYEVVDELYAFLTGRKPVEVLATAHAKSTGADEPMAFVLTYGKGRVFHTALGHDVRAIQAPGTAELIRRGAAWAAGREPAPLTAAQRVPR